MLYLLIKALVSGAIVATVSEVAKRSPALGALVVSLPLTSLLAFIWFYRDAGDTESIASLSQSTFWFILPSLPMFLVTPLLLRSGVNFWVALAAGCALTVALYLLTIPLAAKFGIRL